MIIVGDFNLLSPPLLLVVSNSSLKFFNTFTFLTSVFLPLKTLISDSFGFLNLFLGFSAGGT